MSATLACLQHLLQTGEAVLHERPVFGADDRANLLNLLERAYARHRLAVAGPLLPFDGEASIAAARFVIAACWALVGDDAAGAIDKNLHFTAEAVGPEAHLSGDLTLRYLPTVHRRVRTRQPDEPLHRIVAEALRRWPLSGALADITEPPLGDLTFGNHFGLQLLYAERVTPHLRDAWLPKRGRVREAIAFVSQQRGG